MKKKRQREFVTSLIFVEKIKMNSDYRLSDGIHSTLNEPSAKISFTVASCLKPQIKKTESNRKF